MVWEQRDLSQKDMNSQLLKVKNSDVHTNNNKCVISSPDPGRLHFLEKEEVLEREGLARGSD